MNYFFEHIFINTSNYRYTNMEIDFPNKRIFIRNETGELSIYSLTKTPALIKSLQTSSLSSIRIFHIDCKTDYTIKEMLEEKYAL